MTPFTQPWQARGIPARTLCRLLLILFTFLTPVTLYHILPQCFENDYFAFRSFARFVQLHPPGMIYDYPLLQKFQGTSTVTFPYFYQPQMLLLVWPLAHLPYVPGYAFWMLPGMTICAIVLWFAERNVLAVIAVLVGPSTLLIWINGQSSMVQAGLMFGGFLLLPRRPALAGVLFGLMIYKPQLAVLVPVALLASRQWRTIAVACVHRGVVPVGQCGSVRCRRLDELVASPAHDRHHHRLEDRRVERVMATITANLLMFGATPTQAHIVQAVSTLTW